MGLSSTLANALSGMNATQRGLGVVSRNVANAGTPGYHRQSVVLSEGYSGQSTQVRATSVQRAFDEALQRQHVTSVSQTAFHAVRAAFLDRLQVAFGTPGESYALDKLYANFENALHALSTTPDNMANRAQVLNGAQALAERLNGLSASIQEMRRESEMQIGNAVATLNRELSSLADVNVRILAHGRDDEARLAMMDERDRLVAAIAEKIDVNVTHRADGSVSLMTTSGIGLLDNQPSVFGFASGGAVSANGPVGEISLVTPGGRHIAISGLIRGGPIAGLLDLRDTTLVNAQNQLDEIAAGLARAMSTRPPDTGITTTGTTTSVDLTAMLAGDSFALDYVEGGVAKTVRVVNSTTLNTDPANINASGERVIAVDFSDPAAAATIQTALGGAFTVTDNGAGGLDITPLAATNVSVTTAITATLAQGDGSALPLFIDAGAAFTGVDGQTKGFASRIAVNQALVADPELMVRTDAATSLGDPARPKYLLDNLRTLRFTGDSVTALRDGGVRLSGRVGDLITQTINYQGDTVARAFAQAESSALQLEAVGTRMQTAYGVDVNAEMARLMELQNAYSASARVVSTVQELINALLAI